MRNETARATAPTDARSAVPLRAETAAHAPAGQTLLRVHEACVDFGTVQALRNVSMQVQRGDCIALVGPNGSGKTTLLRLLHGQVRHAGSRQVAPDASAQAMVFQRPFMLRLSVQTSLRLALWLARVPRTERPARAREALQRVGLTAFGARPAPELSAGQQQRLALARAWGARPVVLFLDEPTASLDPSAKHEVEALLSGFVRDGMTLVMSTHNLGQAKRLCNRVVYLEGGEIHADLPSDRFFGGPLGVHADLFVKGELTWN